MVWGWSSDSNRRPSSVTFNPFSSPTRVSSKRKYDASPQAPGKTAVVDPWKPNLLSRVKDMLQIQTKSIWNCRQSAIHLFTLICQIILGFRSHHVQPYYVDSTLCKSQIETCFSLVSRGKRGLGGFWGTFC